MGKRGGVIEGKEETERGEGEEGEDEEKGRQKMIMFVIYFVLVSL